MTKAIPIDPVPVDSRFPRRRTHPVRGLRRVVFVAGLVALGACGDNGTEPENLPPTANFQSPTDQATVTEGVAVTFIGAGTDPEDGALTGGSLAWSSNINGVLGTGSPLSVSNLSQGTHTITLTVTDSDGESDSQSHTVNVETGAPFEVVTTSPLPEGMVGTSYDAALQATGGSGTYMWHVDSGALPDGLSLSDLGTLNGTPRVSGVYDFTLSVESGANQASVDLQLTILPMPGAVNMGYVFVPYPSESYTAGFEEASNLTGGEVHISHNATGNYSVVFTNFGNEASAVTAFVNTVQEEDNATLVTTPAACDLADVRIEGSSGVVDVICRDAVTGSSIDSRFRALIVGEDAIPAAAAFSFHDQLGRAAGQSYTPSATYSWNSASAAQNVAVLGGGRFRHDVGATLGLPRALLVSSYDVISLGRCFGGTTASFLGNSVETTCNSKAGTPAEAEHTVMVLERGRQATPWAFAHVTAAKTLNADHTNNPVGSVTVTDGGPGMTTVEFSGLDAGDTSPAVHVTPQGTSDWVYCSHLRVINDPVTVDVACFDRTGLFVNVAFNVVILK